MLVKVRVGLLGRNFSKEGISGLVTITLSHFNLSILNNVRHLWVQQLLLERMQSIDIVCFKSNKGKATTAPSVLVPHYSYIYHFTKLGEVIFNVNL